jgi:hypothetical protein
MPVAQTVGGSDWVASTVSLAGLNGVDSRSVEARGLVAD